MGEETKEPLIDQEGNQPEKQEENRRPVIDMLNFFKTSFLPTIATIFHPMYQIVNSIYLGQMKNSTLNLAAFGLGSMLINLFMQSIAISFSMQVGTLIGQAYGQKQPKLCAIYFKRHQVLSTLVYIPFAIFLCFSHYVSLAIG